MDSHGRIDQTLDFAASSLQKASSSTTLGRLLLRDGDSCLSSKPCLALPGRLHQLTNSNALPSSRCSSARASVASSFPSPLSPCPLPESSASSSPVEGHRLIHRICYGCLRERTVSPRMPTEDPSLGKLAIKCRLATSSFAAAWPYIFSRPWTFPRDRNLYLVLHPKHINIVIFTCWNSGNIGSYGRHHGQQSESGEGPQAGAVFVSDDTLLPYPWALLVYHHC